MQKEQLLAGLGLHPQEVTIYLALLELGTSNISNISRKTGLYRPVIYKFLPSLIGKALVSESPTGRQKLYRAESPQKLYSLADILQKEIDGFLPELEATFTKREQKPSVKFLSGKSAIQSVFSDLVTTLKKGDIFYRYSSSKDSERGSENLPPHYRELRDQKQLERFVITSEEGAKHKKTRMERALKVIPKEFGLFDYDVTQIIYGNKVAVIDDNSETVIIIENPTIAEFQKKLFKVLFSKL